MKVTEEPLDLPVPEVFCDECREGPIEVHVNRVRDATVIGIWCPHFACGGFFTLFFGGVGFWTIHQPIREHAFRSSFEVAKEKLEAVSSASDSKKH